MQEKAEEKENKTEIMQVVVCLSGLAVAEFARQVSRYLVKRAELTLLYVIDTRPLEELNYSRKIHLFGARAGLHHQEQIEQAEQKLAQDILAEATHLFLAEGFTIKNSLSLVGRPEQQIVQYLQAHPANLVALGIRYKTDLNSGSPGSIGPVARYIIDHAPCGFLVIR